MDQIWGKLHIITSLHSRSLKKLSLSMSSLNPHMAHMWSEVNFHLIYYYVWTSPPHPHSHPTYIWRVISFSSAFKTCYNGNKYARALCFCLQQYHVSHSQVATIGPAKFGGWEIDF